MRASSILFFMSQQQINKEQTHTILLLGSTEQYIRTHTNKTAACVCVCGEIISTHCGDRCNEQRGALRTSIDSSEHFSTERFLPNFTGHSLTHGAFPVRCREQEDKDCELVLRIVRNATARRTDAYNGECLNAPLLRHNRVN